MANLSWSAQEADTGGHSWLDSPCIPDHVFGTYHSGPTTVNSPSSKEQLGLVRLEHWLTQLILQFKFWRWHCSEYDHDASLLWAIIWATGIFWRLNEILWMRHSFWVPEVSGSISRSGGPHLPTDTGQAPRSGEGVLKGRNFPVLDSCCGGSSRSLKKWTSMYSFWKSYWKGVTHQIQWVKQDSKGARTQGPGQSIMKQAVGISWRTSQQ